MKRDPMVRVTLGGRARPKAGAGRPAMRLPTLGLPRVQWQSLVNALLGRGAAALDTTARVAGSGARFVERVADRGVEVPAPRSTWRVRGAAGERLQHDFLVTNGRLSRLSGPLASTDWYGDAAQVAAADVVEFEPAAVDIPGRGAQPVRALLTVPAGLEAGAILRATLFVDGSPDFRLPVELHVARRARRAEE